MSVIAIKILAVLNSHCGETYKSVYIDCTVQSYVAPITERWISDQCVKNIDVIGEFCAKWYGWTLCSQMTSGQVAIAGSFNPHPGWPVPKECK